MYSNVLLSRKLFLLIIVLFLFFPSYFSTVQSIISYKYQLESEEERFGTMIYVDQKNHVGPWTGSENSPFQQISQALRIASPYDTIYILDGIYNETIEVTIPLQLIGIDSPVIDGQYSSIIILIKSFDVYLENLQIIHSDGGNKDAGIFLNHSHNVTINDCIIHHTRTGIFIDESTQVRINNTWLFHSGTGIRIDRSSDILIHSCDFARNSIAVFTQESTEINLNFSTFISNGMSSFFYGSSNITIKKCNISDNSVNKGGMFFSNGKYITLTDSVFRHNGVGISFSNVSSVVIQYCDLVNNTHFAISQREASKQIMILNCKIQDNMRNGIYLEKDSRCTVLHSHFLDNYIFSILAKPGSVCFVRNNWWNNAIGPWSGIFSKTNKISLFQGLIFSFPWQLFPFDDVGIRNISPSPRFNHTFDEPILISCNDLDSDNDGVPDWWEEQFGYDPFSWDDHANLDPDGDGLTNIQEWYAYEWGSDPFRKDIFLELDWMHCEEGEINKPDESWLQRIIDSYAEHNITLHIDLGLLGGGEEIIYDCKGVPTYIALQDMYWTYFLKNELHNPRKGIFHYGLLCNFCPDLNFPFVGWNVMDSFAISVDWLLQTYPHFDRNQIIAGGIAHQLGHTMGLIADIYPGIDNMETLRFLSYHWRTFRNYKSCMNYLYKFRELTFSDGTYGEGDFNDWDHLDFMFFQRGIFK